MTVALAALVLRLAAGAIFVAQGVRKLFAPPEAPHGRRALANMMRQQGLPRPEGLALVVSATELTCGFALLVGLFTRLVALPLAAVLIVAIVGFKRQAGFLGGWDWPFSVLAIDATIVLLGGGPWSLDAAFGIAI